ncbi:hypothetical protein SAMN05444487_11340 [Marininema mesophilum]|uniref:ABC-2 type transport system permease protein n=1 Tax=Marininema mesophilum TaxID=1048340 RepID=A0A1H3ACH1_9BACL|nr:hypothetical protein [Marininema mesophilum]SDX27400.1 hypothetical protein SAMN05444487_11340 [Marininema mesophilum]
MTTGQEILHLLRYELKRTWPALIGTFLLTLTLGGSIALLISSDMAFFKESITPISIPIDILFITMLPYFCTIYGAKEYWSLTKLRQDPFAQQLAWYRTLPISLDGFVMARMSLSLILVAVMCISFFLPFLFFVFGNQMAIGGFLSFSLIWAAYAFGIGSAYTFLEWAKRGIWLFWIPTITIFAIISPLLLWVNIAYRFNIVSWTLKLSVHYPILSVSIAWIGAACLILGWFFLIKNRIRTRDLAID